MPILRRCCCSRDLRTGSIIIGIWTLIWCVISVGLSIHQLTGLYTNDSDYEDYAKNYYEQIPNSLLILHWLGLIGSFLTFLSSILLIVGILKDSAWMLVPWMVCVCGMMLLDAGSIIFNFMLGEFTSVHIIYLLLWIVTTLIYIYSMLCVLSHYKELKAGRGRRSDYLRHRSRPVRYVPAVQHIHIGDGPLNCIQSAHTVYSFHSQALYDDVPLQTNGKHVANGDAGELQLIASAPSITHTRVDENLGAKYISSQPILGAQKYLNNNDKLCNNIPVRERLASNCDAQSGSSDQMQENATFHTALGNSSMRENGRGDDWLPLTSNGIA